jgi:hypothetical protein
MHPTSVAVTLTLISGLAVGCSLLYVWMKSGRKHSIALLWAIAMLIANWFQVPIILAGICVPVF